MAGQAGIVECWPGKGGRVEWEGRGGRRPLRLVIF